MAANTKPKFVFFKMPWCGHCVIFDQGDKNRNMPAVWPQIEADKELNSRVTCKKIVWDPKATPKVALPNEYDGIVTHGPFFWLESGVDPKTNKSIGIEYKGERSHKAIKEWIYKTIETDSNFKTFKSRPAVPGVNTRPTKPIPSSIPKQGQGHNPTIPSRIPNKPNIAKPLVLTPAPPVPKVNPPNNPKNDNLNDRQEDESKSNSKGDETG